jgi:hypothetical protein
MVQPCLGFIKVSEIVRRFSNDKQAEMFENVVNIKFGIVGVFFSKELDHPGL